jgi:RNA polymerase sigma-70 factor (ECF subfamily)
LPSDFTSFFTAELPRTVRSIERIVGDVADDVAQEAFIAALERWDDVRQLDAPDAWVRFVARRIAWRRRGRELERADREWAAESPRLSSKASGDRDLAIDLQRALASLPTRQRAAIRLHHLADLPISETAALLGCGESAAKIWLLRGRRELAESLLGHRGTWVSERRWGVDDVVDRMRETGDEGHIDAVLDGVHVHEVRWTMTLDRGRYEVGTDAGERLDHGRYAMNGRDLVLTPWNKSGIVRMAANVQGNRAAVRLLENTSAPTNGVPDDVYMRLFLSSDAFERRADGDL